MEKSRTRCKIGADEEERVEYVVVGSEVEEAKVVHKTPVSVVTVCDARNRSKYAQNLNTSGARESHD
jgi:hypothetical protein